VTRPRASSSFLSVLETALGGTCLPELIPVRHPLDDPIGVGWLRDGFTGGRRALRLRQTSAACGANGLGEVVPAPDRAGAGLSGALGNGRQDIRLELETFLKPAGDHVPRADNCRSAGFAETGTGSFDAAALDNRDRRRAVVSFL
jgi:hypothetical protein